MEKPVDTQEFQISRKDGKTVYVRSNASPIHNRDNKIIAAASLIIDVTDQKEMELRKDDFVNMASHELKTPITSMKLYIDSLIPRVKKYDDPQAARILTSIKDQTGRLQKLVNDLLDVSRMQTGKLSFTKEDFRLDEVIHETVDLLQDSAKNHEIIIKQTIPAVVHGDRFRMYQVFTNLVTNAVKYSPEGKKIIVNMYAEGSQVITSVQDFGIGIAKSQQEKIFDRLYQVVDYTEKTFPGFGMGLYISREIVNRHDGSIWVESEKGKGSTFFVSLPIAGTQ